jgi:hypothetical protein
LPSTLFTNGSYLRGKMSTSRKICLDILPNARPGFPKILVRMSTVGLCPAHRSSSGPTTPTTRPVMKPVEHNASRRAEAASPPSHRSTDRSNARHEERIIGGYAWRFHACTFALATLRSGLFPVRGDLPLRGDRSVGWFGHWR